MDLENKTYYLYLSDSPQHPVRRTLAKAPTLSRALELVYERMPVARVWRAGEITEVESIEVEPVPSSGQETDTSANATWKYSSGM